MGQRGWSGVQLPASAIVAIVEGMRLSLLARVVALADDARAGTRLRPRTNVYTGGDGSEVRVWLTVVD